MLPCPFGIGGYTNFPRRSERVYEVSWWRGRALPVAPGKAGPDADLPNAAFDPKPAVRQPGGGHVSKTNVGRAGVFQHSTVQSQSE